MTVPVSDAGKPTECDLGTLLAGGPVICFAHNRPVRDCLAAKDAELARVREALRKYVVFNNDSWGEDILNDPLESYAEGFRPVIEQVRAALRAEPAGGKV